MHGSTARIHLHHHQIQVISAPTSADCRGFPYVKGCATMAWYEQKIKYNQKYNKENYARISLMIPPEVKAQIQTAAEKTGKSMTAYIMDAVKKEIENSP